MSLFVSVALFRRNGQPTFRPPRKEASDTSTHARKTAARFWGGAIQEPDKLTKVFVVRADSIRVTVAERSFTASSNRWNPWVEYALTPAEAADQPHIAACLAELGIDPTKAPPPLPDVIEINGAIYRREI